MEASDLLQDNLLHIYKDEQSQPRPSACTMLQAAQNEYACIIIRPNLDLDLLIACQDNMPLEMNYSASTGTSVDPLH